MILVMRGLSSCLWVMGEGHVLADLLLLIRQELCPFRALSKVIHLHERCLSALYTVGA